jgi:hypothetical protein
VVGVLLAPVDEEVMVVCALRCHELPLLDNALDAASTLRR